MDENQRVTQSDENRNVDNKSQFNRQRIDFPQENHREEYATEVSPVSHRAESNDDQQDQTMGQTSKIVGYIGIIMGIAGLFMWSFVLGPIAAVLGFYSYANQSKTVGAWSIGLGLVATLSYFVFNPFVR